MGKGVTTMAFQKHGEGEVLRERDGDEPGQKIASLGDEEARKQREAALQRENEEVDG